MPFITWDINLLEDWHYPLSSFMAQVETYYGTPTRNWLDGDTARQVQYACLDELHMYGSNRLGVHYVQDTVYGSKALFDFILSSGTIGSQFGMVSAAVNAAHIVYMMSDQAHGNKSSNSSSDDGTKDSEGIVSGSKKAKKMSSEEIGEFLGEGDNWHKTAAKSSFLKRFKKELKGDTNADFYI